MENQNYNLKDTVVKNYLQWSDEGKAGVLQYAVGMVLCFFTYFMLSNAIILPIMMFDPEFLQTELGSNATILACFAVPFVIIPFITHWIHKRPTWSVAMPAFKVEKGNLAFGFIGFMVVQLLMSFSLNAIGLLNLKYVGFNWQAFIPMFLISFFGIFIQSSAEELLFRGYLTQAIRRIVKNPFVFILFQAIIFAYPHIGNISAFKGSIFAATPYLISGILFGWTAYKTGSLWMSIGLHWSNNLGNVVLIGLKDDILKTVAPFTSEMPTLEIAIALTLAQSAVMAILILFYIRKK
ncbi:conserved membrane hypothetical protein [Flavobacterium sp. 9R]|uniref:CPBP family intramembrane glutamic endopeptidase n=1 Tax=Flavobacterium sp. 9R TaxID=2653143 RepID=UPI0012F2F767|nr:type II CAAX endopeptidase family protein [Flavobacterium sp. 9R]VXB17357.1 conserved membrane hypothetical protein [Flavobacterium sp. 9R]